MSIKGPPIVGGSSFDEDNPPVHDNRHRERTDRRTKKARGPLREDTFVLKLLEQLDQLEAETRPSSSDPHQKDLKAFQALKSAAWLTSYVAGWAIDHQMGLAMNNLRFVPLQPSQTKKHPEYLSSRAKVDTHEHEKLGSRYLFSEPDPVVTRHFIANLLQAMGGHLRAPTSFHTALLALDYGEILPQVAPIKTSKRSGLTELQCKLKAICFVEYEAAKGVRMEVSRDVVAEKFRTARRSVEGWEGQIRKFMSPLQIDSEKATAHNMGRMYRHTLAEDDLTGQDYATWYENRVGLPALKRAAKAYLKRGKIT